MGIRQSLKIKRSKGQSGGGKGHKGNWIYSYSDMITNLLVFFVVLFITSKVDKEKVKQVAEAITEERVKKSEEKIMQEDLKEILDKNQLSKWVEVKEENKEVTLIIKDNILFSSGETNLTPKTKKLFLPIINSLIKLPDKYKIQIEGHTDDVPISHGPFKTNWHLSVYRSLSVFEYFVENSFPPHKLSVHGHGDGQPMMPVLNKDGTANLESRKYNRRVIIKIRK